MPVGPEGRLQQTFEVLATSQLRRETNFLLMATMFSSTRQIPRLNVGLHEVWRERVNRVAKQVVHPAVPHLIEDQRSAIEGIQPAR
jgi:hypothetical protein